MQRLFTCKVLSPGYLPALRCVVYCGFHHPFCLFISSGQGNTTRQSPSKQPSSKAAATFLLAVCFMWFQINCQPTIPSGHSPPSTSSRWSSLYYRPACRTLNINIQAHSSSCATVEKKCRCRRVNYFMLGNKHTKLIMSVVKN